MQASVHFDFRRHMCRGELSFNLSFASGCHMSSFAAIPKYIRALILGASRCGLFGLSEGRAGAGGRIFALRPEEVPYKSKGVLTQLSQLAPRFWNFVCKS